MEQSKISQEHNFNIGDMVYIWNLELGRPEQLSWVGTVLEIMDISNVTNRSWCNVMWNNGDISSIQKHRLAPLDYRKYDSRHDPKINKC